MYPAYVDFIFEVYLFSKTLPKITLSFIYIEST